MAQIPNHERAVVPREKVVYLLSADHPQNGGKAAFFMAFGFRPDQPDVLVIALQAAAGSEVRSWEVRRHGRFYDMVTTIDAPDGRRPRVRLVWRVVGENGDPVLVTAYPQTRPKKEGG